MLCCKICAVNIEILYMATKFEYVLNWLVSFFVEQKSKADWLHLDLYCEVRQFVPNFNVVEINICYKFWNKPTTLILHFQELDDIKPYPVEIIPGVLYLGNWRQGNAPYVQKDLKIKSHINCCVEAETL